MPMSGGVMFANDGAMMVNTLTPSGTTYNAAWRTDIGGYVYIDATTTPDASNTVFNGGLGFSATTGALYCTEAAPGATSTTSGGISRNALGQAHVTFVKPSTVIFQNGYGLSNTGQIYVAGPIESPAAWYRYGLGLTNAGSGLCSAWADQSGNSRNLVQATGTAQPTIQSDGSLLFDGTSDQMEATFTYDQPATWYLLLKQVTWTATDIVCDGSAAQIQLVQSGASPRLVMTAGGAGFPLLDALAVDTYGAISCLWDGASSLLQINTTTSSTADSGANNPGGFSLGANRSAAAFSNIRVKEVVLYAEAHDATQRARVINYLGRVGDVAL